MPCRRAAVAVLLAASSAGANSVRNEIISSSVHATDATPRASILTNWLNASFDLNDALAFNAGLAITYESPTAAAQRAQFGDSGSLVTLLTSGLDWAATEEWTLGMNLIASPQSTQFAGTPVQAQTSTGTTVNADAQVRSQTWQAGGEIDAAWDSLGVLDLEWSVDGALAYTHYDIDQSIEKVRTSSGTTLTLAALRQECQTRPRPACKALLNVLNATPVQQDFERLSATVTAILFRDTDLSLGGDYYVYQQDPAQVGYFGLAAAGRGPGLPIAPLQWLIRPEVVHRFGDFSVRLWGNAGEYVAGTGQSTLGIGTRLQYRFERAWRVWLTGATTRDVDETNAVTHSLTLSIGAGYRW